LIGGFLWDYSAATTFLLAAVSVFVAFVLCYFWLHPVHHPAGDIAHE
jgi:PPP family 3-phenylpropionic acid transporter